MKKLFLALFCVLTPLSTFAAEEAYYDRPAIEAWLNSDIPRGRGFPVRNAFPSGGAMKFCAGAGCKLKIPFAFSEAQLRHFGDVMNQAVHEHQCGDAAACERLALQFAVREMDRTVKAQKLDGLSLDQAVRYSINKDNGNNPEFFGDKIYSGQWLLRDCVDQAANGSSYLVILANAGLVHHHRVVAPGMINLLMQPHFFTQIREIEGGKHLYRFDLYRTPRTDFDKLPGIERRD